MLYRSDDNEVIYRCEFCQKTFRRVLTYEKHRVTHTGEPVAIRIRCPVINCEFTYSARTDLQVFKRLWLMASTSLVGYYIFLYVNSKDHMLSDHPDKSHSCDQCSKVFFRKQSLMNHKVRIKTLQLYYGYLFMLTFSYVIGHPWSFFGFQVSFLSIQGNN